MENEREHKDGSFQRQGVSKSLDRWDSARWKRDEEIKKNRKKDVGSGSGSGRRTSGWSRENRIPKNDRQIYFSANGLDLVNDAESSLFPSHIFSDSNLRTSLTNILTAGFVQAPPPSILSHLEDIKSGTEIRLELPGDNPAFNIKDQEPGIDHSVILGKIASLPICTPPSSAQELRPSPVDLSFRDPLDQSISNGFIRTLSNLIEISNPYSSSPPPPSPSTSSRPLDSGCSPPKPSVENLELAVYLKWLESQSQGQQKLCGGKLFYFLIFRYSQPIAYD